MLGSQVDTLVRRVVWSAVYDEFSPAVRALVARLGSTKEYEHRLPAYLRRSFRFTHLASWPRRWLTLVEWELVTWCGTCYWITPTLVEAIVKDCKGQPAKVVRALCVLRAAAAWARAVAEDRVEEAEKIVLQKPPDLSDEEALRVLESEAALIVLGR